MFIFFLCPSLLPLWPNVTMEKSWWLQPWGMESDKVVFMVFLKFFLLPLWPSAEPTHVPIFFKNYYKDHPICYLDLA